MILNMKTIVLVKMIELLSHQKIDPLKYPVISEMFHKFHDYSVNVENF